MLVKHLIEELKKMDPNAEVCMEHHYGDYCRTVLAQPIYEPEEMTVCWSESHDCYAIVKDEDPDDDEPTGTVVVLRVGDQDKPEWAEQNDEEE